MSLREASSKLLERAEKRRGQWTPKAGSWYFRYYEDYRERNPYAKIGRCDFFHKVFLEMLYKAASLVFVCFGILAGAAVLVLVAIIAIKFSAAAVVVLFTLAGLVYLFGGLGVSGNLAYRYIKDTPYSYRMGWITDRSSGFQALLVLFFLPAILLIGAVLLLGWCVKHIVIGFLDSKIAEWFVDKELLGFELLRPFTLTILAAIVAAQWIPGVWMADLFVVAVLVIFAVVIGFIIVIGDWHDRAEEKRLIAALKYLEDGEVMESLPPKKFAWFGRAVRGVGNGIGSACSAALGFVVYLWTILRYLRRVICPVMVDPEGTVPPVDPGFDREWVS